MSAAVKQRNNSDEVTRELWRAAESGDVDELARILPLIGDVNARNKYGMTALMKAAYHGHEQIVRALLNHGADPNLTRHDRFTALALAAFFGHTETVRVLIEHGARTEVVTRCGTSAYMWATARTFDEAARCIREESTAPKVTREPVVQNVIELQSHHHAAVAPAVVKTLKDPPEIWDLVHEEPRGFDPGSAFLSRISSMNRSLALGILAVSILFAGCVVGLLVLRRSQARTLQPNVPSNQSATVSQSRGAKAGTAVTEPEVNEVPSTDVLSNHHALELPEEKAVGSRKQRLLIRQHRPRSSGGEEVVESVQSREVPPGPTVESPKLESRSSSVSSTKSKPDLSPQLIAPVKGASPKAKVIQWP